MQGGSQGPAEPPGTCWVESSNCWKQGTALWAGSNYAEGMPRILLST